jgi:hypothetical protein
VRDFNRRESTRSFTEPRLSTAHFENCVISVHLEEHELGHKQVISENRSKLWILFGQFPMNLKNFVRKMKMYLYLAEDTSGVHSAGLVHSIER